ncbi:MAG: hypothetical protein INQ03_08155 [Candidatus Heimdallarchaeota archaeon]|nr:hypothetical protein [Candidatus Heimdallarchaeota archaeon]
MYCPSCQSELEVTSTLKTPWELDTLDHADRVSISCPSCEKAIRLDECTCPECDNELSTEGKEVGGLQTIPPDYCLWLICTKCDWKKDVYVSQWERY